MFADAVHKSPFCMPEAKAALADLWTHSLDRVEKMHVVAQQRSSESAGVPMSAAVPRYVDAVGKGNRIDRFTKVKASAMLTVCGTQEWAKSALQ
eukprot:13047560-Alexandrium_andersonii.AAC.1